MVDPFGPGRPLPRVPLHLPHVAKVLADEAAAGLHDLEGHDGFDSAVAAIRNDFVEFLIECSRKGARSPDTVHRARAILC